MRKRRSFLNSPTEKLDEGTLRLATSIKRAVQRIMPAQYERWRHRVGYPARMRSLANRVIAAQGPDCVAGPFRGMKLATTVTGSYIPKLLGSYEQELHATIDEIVRASPRRIIDIGCGEGFYLVGLARLIPAATCVGFDINVAARNACKEQAAINRVSDRIFIDNRCDAVILSQYALNESVVIADCEGFELELLNPQLCQQLKTCMILVELHEFLSPGVTGVILERFKDTHIVKLIDVLPRDRRAYPQLNTMSDREAAAAMSESRPAGMQWCWIMPANRCSKGMA